MRPKRSENLLKWEEKLLLKILKLQNHGFQTSKCDALIAVYYALCNLNLNSTGSVDLCLETIKGQLKYLESFSSDEGEFLAKIKQSIFSTGCSVTLSNTRFLVGELMDFIENNAFQTNAWLRK